MLKKKMSGLELFFVILTMVWILWILILNMNEDPSANRTDEQELNYRVESWRQQFNNHESYDNYDDYNY